MFSSRLADFRHSSTSAQRLPWPARAAEPVRTAALQLPCVPESTDNAPKAATAAHSRGNGLVPCQVRRGNASPAAQYSPTADPLWCRGRDSNPHGGKPPPDFESGASTNSTTPAPLECSQTIIYILPETSQRRAVGCRVGPSPPAHIGPCVVLAPGSMCPSPVPRTHGRRVLLPFSATGKSSSSPVDFSKPCASRSPRPRAMLQGRVRGDVRSGVRV